MAFDLSAALNAATQVATQKQTENKGDLPKLIYPGHGELKVKLLFNPKSNLVTRSIKRHKINNTNYTCLGMYGQDCPICKSIDNIVAAKNLDLWQLKAKTRGLTYAQYIGSNNYQWEQGREPEVGELILLMYPWSVYQDINKLISNAGANAAELIAKNDGKVFSITRSRENGRERYGVSIDPWSTYTSISTSNGPEADEQAFEQYLSELPDLSTAIVKADCTDEVIQAARSAAEALTREYLSTGIAQPQPQAQPQQFQPQQQQVVTSNGQSYQVVNGQYVPIQSQPQVQPQQPIQQVPTPPSEIPFEQATELKPATTPSATSASGGAMPQCFGKHVDGSPQCMGCAQEITCMVTK